jgi:diadenylate cyclase
MSFFDFSNFLANFPVFQTRDFIDISIVTIIIYLIITFIRQSRSYFIVYALLFLFGVNYLARVLNLSLTRLIFQPLLTFVLLFFVVVFQREIRRFFEWFSAHSRRLTAEKRIALSSDSAKTIAESIFEMASKKIGAIIVFPGDYALEQIVEGGFGLDGRISRPLLLSIFDASSPGHDGAMIIDNNRIKKFGVHLPLAEKFNKFAVMGTRHRAASGITQRTDAVAIVVSEERGEISWSEKGELNIINDKILLEQKIAGFLKENLDLAPAGWRAWLLSNWSSKLLSVVLAVVLWFVFVYQIGVTSEIYTVPIEFKYLPKEMTIEEISPAKMDITLSGNYRDLRNLDTSRDLKVAIDAKNIVAGKQRIIIDDSNIQYPPFLSFVEKNTKTVTIKVIENASSTESFP